MGIDVGGTNVKAVVREESGAVSRRRLSATPADPDEIVDLAASLAAALGAGAPVGVAMAGLVDHASGVLRWAPHLPGVEVEVRARLEKRLGVSVVVENDANAAAVAEHRQGAAAGANSAVMLTLGTGIGMGVIDSGRLVRGRGHAGEVGHVTVQPDGAACACGRKGCWETLVSGRRLDADARMMLGPQATAADLVAAAHRGDPAAHRALAHAARWLAIGIEAIALIFDPEVIVVGGAAAGAGDLLLGPARRRLGTTEGAGYRTPSRVAAGILGADAGAVGAAILAAGETADA